ncbi:hypothetical protein F0169_04160 [Pseudomonas sp. MAFF 212408]|uniref:Uncharacterized protein n=1 Tax=Pseudomonas kitaguniensis TaxID=2607908 RepID=A0A5N7KH17_9PSED|nr:hypothetical protein [Pseudomonas kitaguniensis]MPR01340.1 hypothetical protein [Pseudomonas kitaguniensis]
MKTLNIPDICDHIAVQAPYFAFERLEGQRQTISGDFVSEQNIGYERGGLSYAEIGRHLAILGSCAAVVDKTEGKNYYLASKATLRIFRSPNNERKFQASAEVITQSKRVLVISATASDGQPFAHLNCEYQILSEAVFAKAFSGYKTARMPLSQISPYSKPIELDFYDPDGWTLTAKSKPLLPDCFPGHFSEFPTWPVAIIAGAVGQVTTRLLHHMLNKKASYNIAHIDLIALKLTSSVEPLFFDVESTSASAALSRYTFSAKIRTKDLLVATIEIELYT